SQVRQATPSSVPTERGTVRTAISSQHQYTPPRSRQGTAKQEATTATPKTPKSYQESEIAPSPRRQPTPITEKPSLKESRSSNEPKPQRSEVAPPSPRAISARNHEYFTGNTVF